MKQQSSAEESLLSTPQKVGEIEARESREKERAGRITKQSGSSQSLDRLF